MNNLKQLERLRKLHKLIKSERTGTPYELSKRLRISVRQTFLMLEQLKELDAPVKYNRYSKNYYYEFEYDLSINISIQVLAKDKLKNIYAGKSFSTYLFSLQGSCSKPNYLSYLKIKLDVAG